MVKYSYALRKFINDHQFNLLNLNEVNKNGVTPLTAAIEHKQIELIAELLLIVNPLVENIHGNTPLELSLLLGDSFIESKINQAISSYSCDLVYYFPGEQINYLNNKYIITKIIQGGACSLATMEIQNCHDFQVYFAKIKSNFGGLELRNYISLNKYVDLFKIDKLIIPKELEMHVNNKVYCLIQKHISGTVLSETFKFLSNNNTAKQSVARSAIKALCDLHLQGYIHNDALPDNCIWDPIVKVANFIDYDVMRNFTDYDNQDYEYLMNKKIADLEKLILGGISELSGKKILGLKDYIEDIDELLKNCSDIGISEYMKEKLLKSIIFNRTKLNQIASLKI